MPPPLKEILVDIRALRLRKMLRDSWGSATTRSAGLRPGEFHLCHEPEVLPIILPLLTRAGSEIGPPMQPLKV